MNSEIGSAIKHSRLDLLDKYAFAAHCIDRNVKTLISHRFHDHFFNHHRRACSKSGSLQQCRDVIGLPKRKRASTRL